jgi:CubicO group peptidase (beta-lactamase class C family)
VTADAALRQAGAALERGIAEHRVPGAVLGVLHQGDEYVLAAGVIDSRSCSPTRPDTRFRIGSITKTMTASLVMQLVDDALVDLDRPVRDYLPEFQVRDGAASAGITARQLLSHGCGVDGDFFVDTGADFGACRDYLRHTGSLRQLHPPGEGFSYCNFGFIAAGALIEALSGRAWDEVLTSRLLAPLDIRDAITRQASLRGGGVAAGHDSSGRALFEPGSDRQQHSLPASAAPAGNTLAMTGGELLRFVRMHLDSGSNPSGRRVLSPFSVREMTTPQVELPPLTAAGAASWGLGWCLYDWNGTRLFGHDGDIDGQYSFLRIEPESATALVLLTNGGAALDLAADLFAALFPALAGVHPPELPAVDTDYSCDPSGYAGRYTRLCRRLTVEGAGTRLQLLVDDGESTAGGAAAMPLERVDGQSFRYRPGNGRTPACLRFCHHDRDGVAQAVLAGYRLAVRSAYQPEDPK